MPMISFSPNTPIRSADVNNNFANSLALDTPRSVVVTHNWNARQQFNNGITVGGTTELGALSASGAVTAPRFRAEADGAVGNVAYGFAGGGVGIYRESSSDLRFVANDSGRMRITGSVIQALGTVTFTGNGSGLTDLDASMLATGTVPNARIGGNYNNINNLSVGSLNVGGGSNVAQIRHAQAIVNFGNVGDGNSTSVEATGFGTFTANARVFACIAGPPVGPPPALLISVSLVAANSVRLSVYNGGPGTWDGSNAVVRVLIIEPPP